ncbi:hypothetical protein TNCV_1671411 [Trichonephila clavipes]|nr:hypothetical protein TNCV_1671411 [Trichonephila clavipes]
MLNDDKFATFMQEESDSVDDEADEDEGNNNESSKGPSNTDAFSALETDVETNNNQSAVLLNYCCSKESQTLHYPNNRASERYPFPFDSDKRHSTVCDPFS